MTAFGRICTVKGIINDIKLYVPNALESGRDEYREVVPWRLRE
jgi:hypothetical protein